LCKANQSLEADKWIYEVGYLPFDGGIYRLNTGQDDSDGGIFKSMSGIYGQAFGIYCWNAGIIKKKRVSEIRQAVFMKKNGSAEFGKRYL
jgi:hypothetical protein